MECGKLGIGTYGLRKNFELAKVIDFVKLSVKNRVLVSLCTKKNCKEADWFCSLG